MPPPSAERCCSPLGIVSGFKKMCASLVNVVSGAGRNIFVLNNNPLLSHSLRHSWRGARSSSHRYPLAELGSACLRILLSKHSPHNRLLKYIVNLTVLTLKGRGKQTEVHLCSAVFHSTEGRLWSAGDGILWGMCLGVGELGIPLTSGDPWMSCVAPLGLSFSLCTVNLVIVGQIKWGNP